jgi:phosphoribosyl-AMP cyclohydrolase
VRSERRGAGTSARDGTRSLVSRSNETLWQKGETSGHVQHVEEIRLDCDGDALPLRIEQEGGTRHTGFELCFYRTFDGKVVGERVFDPDTVYE